MNLTINNSLFNLSMGFTEFGYNPDLPKECWGDGQYSAECIYKIVCSSLDNWIVQTGIIIVISFIILTWLTWWFFKYGYKYIPKYEHNKLALKIFGNIQIYETRIYWNNFIRDKLLKVCIAYIGVVVYLNL